ncbi:hypothetical protein ANN_22632 [Periplaneta americana]|uniref:Uncharacterized protein n=1 Tax=Periplaneta americana TaxID=6978 RepID=A0ABQ8S9I4_PERAM|nr:hypothetical protein ANN_22632 [Periplaneta americana]
MVHRFVGTILRKRLRLHPYLLQLLQALKPEDKVLQRNFCTSMQTLIENDDEFIRSVVFSDDVTFQLSDALNSAVCCVNGTAGKGSLTTLGNSGLKESYRLVYPGVLGFNSDAKCLRQDATDNIDDGAPVLYCDSKSTRTCLQFYPFHSRDVIDVPEETTRSARDKQISDLANKIDDLQQYQMRQSIRIFGIPEESGENADKIAVIWPETSAEMCSYRNRSEVFFNKKKLKGSGMVIREDLTTVRHGLLQETISKTYGVPSCWTLNGIIFIKVVVITEDVQNVHLLLEYRPHIDVSLTCEHDPKLQEYCVCPQNMPQFDSEGIPNQAPDTNKPMILNGPTSRNPEGSDQVSVEAKQLGHLYLSIDQETFDPSTGEPYD